VKEKMSYGKLGDDPVLWKDFAQFVDSNDRRWEKLEKWQDSFEAADVARKQEIDNKLSVLLGRSDPAEIIINIPGGNPAHWKLGEFLAEVYARLWLKRVPAAVALWVAVLASLVAIITTIIKMQR
jgi:hypothetical protein